MRLPVEQMLDWNTISSKPDDVMISPIIYIREESTFEISGIYFYANQTNKQWNKQSLRDTDLNQAVGTISLFGGRGSKIEFLNTYVP